ncbi:Prophage minor tail protein Z (GPZ) [Caballeronia fortuita]|uniref:Prophage minor tail protein Z (GPZ) n=1 Tax=Caballeronia fortuita TaxID=1777138 RepID=A0A158E9Q7_9BURK|nr:hypothetical protein [Caballeronia fortuita]SAL03126.1 Prophage minor tail protein Z (GPZ) [Caballeronia fortuita]
MPFLEIDERGSLEQVAHDLAATQKEIDKALASTLSKMATWLRAKSVRELAKHLKLPPKEVKRRLKTFRLRRNARGKSVTVWYGLDPMGVIHLGAWEERAMAGGVHAFGERFYQGAFIANGRAGNGGAAASNKQVFQRVGKSRLKIKKVTADLGDEAQKYIEDHLLGGFAFEQRFYMVFERELKWRQSK